jgi:hypothetical protein
MLAVARNAWIFTMFTIIKTFCSVLLLVILISCVRGQAQTEGHVYPRLRKCVERIRANDSFEVSVALASVWTKEEKAATKFDWNISSGTITDGQGTEKITVLSGSDADRIYVNVDMKGPMFPNVSESCSVAVDPLPKAVLFDESKFVTQGYLKRILDAYFVELDNNPTSQGYLMMYAQLPRHYAQIERVVKSHMRVRRFDATRITLVRSEKNPHATVQLWVVPAGAENPIAGLTGDTLR